MIRELNSISPETTFAINKFADWSFEEYSTLLSLH